MRLLAPLLLPLLVLAGCAAPQEPLLADPGSPQGGASPPSAPPASQPPAQAPPSASAPPAPANNTTAEPGSDAWDGTMFLNLDHASTNDGPHTLVFQGSVALNLTITLTGGVSQGDLRVRVDVGPAGGCGSEQLQDPETVLDAEGPSPLAAAGVLEAGSYCVWVEGAAGSVHVGADYAAEAAWVPAP